MPGHDDAMTFEKWEAVGNDFVLVDATGCPPDLWSVAPHNERARRICDRRRGVGADGVLAIEDADGSRPRMHIWNADGSRAAMCGNGVRCVACYVVSRHGAAPADVTIVTDAGERPCHVEAGDDDGYDVAVAMGQAQLAGVFTLEHQGQPLRFRRVSMGNPHHVCLELLPESALDSLGPSLDAAIAGGTNVELVRDGADGRSLRVSVWERGAGRTLACGTGACAAAAVAVAEGRRPAGQRIDVALPGGTLWVTVAEPGLQVELRGAARRVFRGELTPTR
jgi:diaminopimelate epimerase